MKGNINSGEDERLKNTVAKDSKKYNEDIHSLELELAQTEHKLMVRNIE